VDYRDAMNAEKNNEALKARGFPQVFGLRFPPGISYYFGTPVVLYSIEFEKPGSSRIVIREREYTDYGSGRFIFDIKEGLSIEAESCFATREFAEIVLSTIQELYGKKVRFMDKEYYVCNWLNPHHVGLYEEFVPEIYLSEMLYARLDELEF